MVSHTMGDTIVAVLVFGWLCMAASIVIGLVATRGRFPWEGFFRNGIISVADWKAHVGPATYRLIYGFAFVGALCWAGTVIIMLIAMLFGS